MTRVHYGLVVSAIFAAACLGSSVKEDAGGTVASEGLDEAAETITAGSLEGHIAYLASDRLRGRDTPSAGLDSAAAYLARAFDDAGLTPAGGDGRFIQRYGFPRVALAAERAGLEVRGPDGARDYVYGDEFFAMAGRPGTVRGGPIYLGEAPVAVGGRDVRGRIAVVELPGQPDRAWQTVVDRTRERVGAAGGEAVAFVLDPSVGAGTVEQLSGIVSEPRRILGGIETVPAVFVRAEPGRALLDAARAGGGAASVALSAPVEIVEDASAPNVAALLPGGDPALRDRYVVLSAHVDHIGVGRPDAAGDSIYNGADDNASGVSALLAVAEAFASLEEAPARSVLFLGVSGEEKGLLGSRWYTEHPTVPLDRIVANLNMDMIARNAPDSIVAIGQEYSSLGPLVQRVASERPELDLTVAEDRWPEQRFFFRSDHFNFAREEIPAIFFFAGTHEDYHRPSDEAEDVNLDKAARVARLIFYTTHAVAAAPDRPEWTAEGIEAIRDLVR